MIVLFEMNYLVTEKPYHLNTPSLGHILVGKMFGWRKKDSSKDDNICPYCNTPNIPDAKECKLCYYELNVSARDQPMATPSSTESEIMTTLLDASIEEEDEEYAVEAVLSLDEVTVEIDQFEVESQDNDAGFDFISSSGPTLSQVQDYQLPEEVELNASDAPKKKIDFVVPESNPLDEVQEPVHTGQGSLFTVNSENTEDMSGTVGPASKGENMQPQIITEEQVSPEVQLTSTESVEIIETPEIPEIITNAQELNDLPAEVEENIETPDLPANFDQNVEVNHEQTPEIPDIPDTIQQESSVVTEVSKPAPIPQTNGRIWPWPAKEAWDERQVYREVVAMLELVKTGKLSQTAQLLDALGPHLENNLDMLAHIGTIMRYLGREEHLQWMLKMAQINYPEDQNVALAINHLS